MSIPSVVILCLAAAVLALTLRAYRAEFAMLVSLACGVLVLLLLLTELRAILDALNPILVGLGDQRDMIAIVLKALGICIVAELGSQCCRDAGETGIATKVELAAKVSLVYISLPLFSRLLTLAEELLRL